MKISQVSFEVLEAAPQLTFAFSETRIKTIEKDVKYNQS